MSSIIKPKHTTTAGSVPTTSNIADGEFCINTTDRVIYKRVGSTIIPVASLGGTPRVVAITSSSAPTPNCDITDLYDVTALATAPTFGAPTGTAKNGQKLMFRIKDNGTARALAWNAAYVAGGVALPTTTVISKTLTIGFIYNTANSLNKWMCVASAQET